jgi:hypothetical protein
MGALPTPKFYGDRPVITGERQVAAMPASKAAQPPLPLDRYFRRTHAPDATAMSAMCEQMNAGILFRSKEVFSRVGILGSGAGVPVSSAGAGARIRWRFAFHTGPYHHALFIRAFLYPQTSGFNSNSASVVDIYAASGTALGALQVATPFYYGNNPLNTLNIAGWQYMKRVDQFVTGLLPDTDYYGLVYDQNDGIVQSISIADLQSMSNNYAGYLPQNFTQDSLILDEYRQNLVAPMPLLWKRGGASVFHWTVESDASPKTIAANTATNLMDGTSTTYGASILGYTLDMRGKARLSQAATGVPVVIKAWMKCTTAASGVVHLRDSTGTIVATLTNTLGAGTVGYITATCNLPATSAKYYLTFQTSAGTLSVYAVSCYQYET